MNRSLLALAGLLALTAPAAAQSDVPVEATGVEAGAGAVARVVIDFAELRAGPGQAYVSRGRVYQGDEVEVLKGADTGGWIEVLAVGGSKGWLRSRDIKVVAGKTARPSRVEEKFQYDEKGRRIGPDGRPIGSGEGARRTATPEDFDLDSFEDGAAVVTPGGGDGDLGLTVRAGGGATQIQRAFGSNAPPESILRSLTSKPLGYGFDVEVGYAPLDYVAVRGLFRDVRFTETRLQTAAYNGGQPFGLSVDAQQGELDVLGTFPILDGWVGAYVGGRFWRQAYRELQPTPIFLTTTWLGLGAGGAAGWAFGPVDLSARGGVVLPFDISQTPVASGEPEAFGFGAGAEVAWSFMPSLAVVGHWHYSKLTTDFSGPATHVDAGLNAQGATYTQAQSIDSLHGGGLGIRWTP